MPVPMPVPVPMDAGPESVLKKPTKQKKVTLENTNKNIFVVDTSQNHI